MRRNTSSAQKRVIKRKASEERIKVKSLFCTRALFGSFQDLSVRKEPFLRPHYGCSKHAWHQRWLCAGLAVLQDPVGLLAGPGEGTKLYWSHWGLAVAGTRNLVAGCPARRCFAAGGFLVAPHPASPRVPACSPRLPSPPASLIYLFLHAELSKINPEPRASAGRGGRGGEQQALKNEALQPSQEVAVPKCEMIAYPRFCKVLQLRSHFHLSPFPLPPLPPPFSSLFFCRMLQGKENLWKWFQELFSLPWC